MLIILNYYLSRVMLNTKRIAKDFQKSGNYFDGIYPGDDTRHYLDRRAKKISAIGALIIGLSLVCRLLVLYLYLVFMIKFQFLRSLLF